MDKPKISVLFVCLGNICRSPMAETIFEKLANEKDLQDQFNIDSAGLIDYHEGEPADSRMRKYANERGYNITHLSRPIKKEDFDKFDLIIGMDNQNMSKLNSIAAADEKNKLSLMTEYLETIDADIVPDPYYGDREDFIYVINLLEDACDGLLNYLIKREK